MSKRSELIQEKEILENRIYSLRGFLELYKMFGTSTIANFETSDVEFELKMLESVLEDIDREIQELNGIN